MKSLLLTIPVILACLTSCQNTKTNSNEGGDIPIPSINYNLSTKGKAAQAILNSKSLTEAINSQASVIVILPSDTSIGNKILTDTDLESYIAPSIMDKDGNYTAINGKLWIVPIKGTPPVVVNGINISKCNQTFTRKSTELGASATSYVCESESLLF